MPNDQSFDTRTTNPANRAVGPVGLSVAAVVASPPTGPVSGENADLAFALSGTSTGDTLTVTAKGATSFGSVGPEFVILIDSSQRDGNGDATPRIGTTSTDTNNNAAINELQSDAAMPSGSGIQLGASDSVFGSTSPPFRLRVDTPAHFKSFESKVTYLPSARRQPIVDALAADVVANGLRSENDWGFKNIWNASSGASVDFGDSATGAAFLFSDLYDWFNSGEYWLNRPAVFSNVPSFQKIFMDSVRFSAQGNSTTVNNNYWRDEPHQTEFYYDLGSLDTTVSDSTAYAEIFTPTTLIGKVNRTGEFMKNSNDAQTVPMAHFTYPGFVRGFNIPDGNNAVENLIYKAVGDGAYCRVAICNNADYFLATQRTILEVSAPADWTSGQITARLHGGWFDLTNLIGQFINVVGIDNTQIASVEIT